MLVLDADIHAVRRFSRFYTRRLGLLDEGQLASRFSLAETRVLYELAHREAPTASELARDLALDPGYLSRILKGFEAQGLVERARSTADGRVSTVTLTESGRDAFAPLEQRSHEAVAAMMAGLPPERRRAVVAAIEQVRTALDGGDTPPVTLRAHRPGDMGWVVQRHGELYASEYGWDGRFEALVAGIVARFIGDFDPEREACWIAERAGARLGSAFLVRHPDEAATAKLRLLLVEPDARGTGLGGLLVDTCVGFARERGYRRIALWTNSCLDAARHLYERRGFRLVASEPHHSFGHELVGETWELTLG